MSASWIKKLNEDNGRLHKEDVIRQALEAASLGSKISQFFLKGLKECYNPYVTFGVKQIPESHFIANAENPWDEFAILLNDLANRRLTGNSAREAITDISIRFNSDEWNEFLAPILRRDMRCGISATTINKIVKDTEYEIPIFGCQLASDSEDRPEMRGIKRLERKLDGVRVLMSVTFPDYGGVNIVSYSRNGKVFENFQHIEEQIEANMVEILKKSAQTGKNGFIGTNGFVLDGEVVGNSFQELMRQARRKEDVQNDDSVFHVFDIIPVSDFVRGFWNAQLSKRIRILDRLKPIFDNMANVELLAGEVVDLDTPEGQTLLRDFANKCVAEGFEGIMIKDLDAPYECRRSTSWMKWKPTITVDLQVVGIEEGTGRNKGRMGALVCAGEDNGREITVNVGSGFDDRFRAQIWADVTGKPVSWQKKAKKEWVTMTEYPSGQNPAGRMAEILADAVTQNQDGTYSLRFPRFVRFRDDK